MGDEPTQITPKGAEIPVPTRGQVLADLAKTLEPVKHDKPKKDRKRRRK